MRSRLLSGAATPILGKPQASAGARLISRQWFRAGATIPVPDGAGWISARAVGAGGPSDPSSGFGGGGAAFAREDRACFQGQSISMTMSGLSLTGFRPDTEITLDGALIVRANSASTSGGTPGLAANSIGTIRASGGNGSYDRTASTPGTNGGQNGSGSSYTGGGSAGESNVADALILGGIGADLSNGRGGFPGAGASTFVNRGSSSSAAGGDPVAVIEFWSAKP